MEKRYFVKVGNGWITEVWPLTLSYKLTAEPTKERIALLLEEATRVVDDLGIGEIYEIHTRKLQYSTPFVNWMIVVDDILEQKYSRKRDSLEYNEWADAYSSGWSAAEAASAAIELEEDEEE